MVNFAFFAIFFHLYIFCMTILVQQLTANQIFVCNYFLLKLALEQVEFKLIIDFIFGVSGNLVVKSKLPP